MKFLLNPGEGPFEIDFNLLRKYDETPEYTKSVKNIVRKGNGKIYIRSVDDMLVAVCSDIHATKEKIVVVPSFVIKRA